MNDFNPHKSFKCEPADVKLVERMHGMYELICTQSRDASECIASMAAIDGTSYQRIGPVLMVIADGEPKFRGVAMCTHCIQRAAMLLRDLANTCDDLVKVVEENGKPIR